jgi:hypothetical protein
VVAAVIVMKNANKIVEFGDFIVSLGWWIWVILDMTLLEKNIRVSLFRDLI